MVATVDFCGTFDLQPNFGIELIYYPLKGRYANELTTVVGTLEKFDLDLVPHH